MERRAKHSAPEPHGKTSKPGLLSDRSRQRSIGADTRLARSGAVPNEESCCHESFAQQSHADRQRRGTTRRFARQDPELASARSHWQTNRAWTDRNTNEKREKTEWHRLTFFGRLVDIVEQYVKKGDRLYVEGRIEYSQTEGDGGTEVLDRRRHHRDGHARILGVGGGG